MYRQLRRTTSVVLHKHGSLNLPFFNRPLESGSGALLLCFTLLTGCAQSAPPTGPVASTNGASPTVATHRVIIQFSRAVDAQNPKTLAALAHHGRASSVVYLRSLSADTHLYLVTAPPRVSIEQLLRTLRSAGDVKTVELDQKAFEQAP